MNLTYEVYVRHEVYRALAEATARDRDRILTFIESLANDPFRQSQLITRDVSGRVHQIEILGKLAIYYWSDHAEKEVRVVDLVDADRVD